MNSMRNIIAFAFIASMLIHSAGFSQEKYSLDKCLTIAVNNNFDLQIEQEAIANVQAKLRQTKAQRLPQLGFDASYLRFSDVMEASIAPKLSGVPFQIEPMSLRFGDEDNYTTRLNFAQPLFTGFQLKESVLAVESQLEAARSNKKKTLNQLCYDVKRNYYNLYKARQVKEAALLSLQSINAHLKDVQNLFDQGMIKKTDVLQVQIKRSEIELMISQAENRIELFRKALLNLLGLDLSTDFELNEDELSVQSPELNNPQGPHIRPELTQLHFQKKSLKHLVCAAKGRQYPTLSLFGYYDYSKPGLNKLENEWMGYWAVGIKAQWSIWDWGIRRSKQQQAQVAFNQAVLANNKLERALQLDVENARLNLKEAAQRITLARQTRTLSEEIFKLTDSQFKQGLLKNTDYLDAETQLTHAKIEEFTALADYRIAAADFDRAIGVWNFPALKDGHKQ